MKRKNQKAASRRLLTRAQSRELRKAILNLWHESRMSIDEVADEIGRRFGWRWIKAALVACVLSVELHRIDDAERAAWCRWDRSKRNGPGDARALKSLLDCIDQRCHLLRLYPAP